MSLIIANMNAGGQKNIYISQINRAHVLLYTHAGVAESIK